MNKPEKVKLRFSLCDLDRALVVCFEELTIDEAASRNNVLRMNLQPIRWCLACK